MLHFSPFIQIFICVFAFSQELKSHFRFGYHLGKSRKIILHQALYVFVVQPASRFVSCYYQILWLVDSVHVVEPEFFHVPLKIRLIVQQSVMFQAYFIIRSQWYYEIQVSCFLVSELVIQYYLFLIVH